MDNDPTHNVPSKIKPQNKSKSLCNLFDDDLSNTSFRKPCCRILLSLLGCSIWHWQRQFYNIASETQFLTNTQSEQTLFNQACKQLLYQMFKIEVVQIHFGDVIYGSDGKQMMRSHSLDVNNHECHSLVWQVNVWEKLSTFAGKIIKKERKSIFWAHKF